MPRPTAAPQPTDRDSAAPQQTAPAEGAASAADDDLGTATIGEVEARFDVAGDEGLAPDDAARRLQEHGPNEIAQQEGRSLLDVIVDQFLSPIVYILVAAGVAAFIAGEIIEAIAILIAVLINAVIGVVTEVRAMQSVESLRELGRTTATVRRGGASRTIDGAELVPGDVVVLDEGDVVPADLRLLESANLQVDEAPLTGESEPVRKGTDPVEPDTPLAEQTAMAFKGTRITGGSGEGIVTATGMRTRIGDISTMVEEAGDDVDTPLEQRLDALGKALIGAVIVVGILVAVGGIAVGQPVQEMIETAIALAIAAVPEGLAIVATLALARGVVRMARRNALVKRLASVETLGSAGVIFTDKTGTLTEGRMQARVLLLGGGHRVDLEGDPVDDAAAMQALAVAALCGNATVAEDPADDTGDPMEVALQRAAVEAGLGDRAALDRHADEIGEVAFDRDTKMMATLHRLPERGSASGSGAIAAAMPDAPGSVLVAVKGAPGAVIDACSRTVGGEALDDDARSGWLQAQEELAGEGLRVLGLARKVVDAGSVEEVEAYADLELLGMVGLLDPPRAATPDAIAACHTAGVEVVMVTGDQPATAEAIARQIGLLQDDSEIMRGADIPPVEEWDDAMRDRLGRTRVFARLDPRQKLDLIQLAQDRGAVVGMTGDGVNDAPALKAADIGIAMGQQGTQVARDAADIILQDDAFETIVEAIREGRTIFANITRMVVFLLSGNLGEILAVVIAALAGGELPLLPLQILYINLVSDVFPASALGLVKGDHTVLEQPPRDPSTPIMNRSRWVQTGGWAVLIGGATLATFAYALGPAGLEVEAAVTVSFMAFVIARLLHAFNLRDPRQPMLTNPLVRSGVLWISLALSFGLLLLGLYLPPLADVLGVVTPTPQMWALAGIGGVSVLVLGQLALQVARVVQARRQPSRA